jgi:glucose-6-phosphate isomerase
MSSDRLAVDADLPADLDQAVAARVARAGEEDVVRRLWARDGTLWAPERSGDERSARGRSTPEVTDRLGWLDIADRLLDDVDDLEGLAAEVRADGHTDAVLCGMGGSSLAPEVFRRSWPDPAMRLHVLDSTHPDQVQAVLDAVDLDRTLVIVSSKSGGTIETLSHFKLFHARQPDGAHYVAVTDPGTALAALAAEHGFRRTFENDPEIGGRYSALSYFGLVPAALLGVDLRAVLESARDAAQACRATTDENPGLWLGAALGELAVRGRDKLTFVVDEPLGAFGLWAEQLVAESTGKRGRGILPVADEPLVEPAAYGPDRVFLHVAVGDDDHARRVAALRAAGHPVLTLHADGPTDLGRIFFVAELATAVAGWALGINPFDQPNVQEAKDNTKRVLEEGSPDLAPGDLDALLAGVEPPAYVAIMAYLPYDAGTDAAAGRLRARLVQEHGVATTFGYGPRFLHSTGQLHKGGPTTGRFVQVVDEPATDLDVPGEPFSFGRLIRAQADGDLQTLRAHGLDAVRVGKEIL